MSTQPHLIQTQRLALRPYTHADLEGLRAVFADPYAAQFYPHMNAQASLERWIHWNLQNYQTHGFGLWAMELLETGVFIGDAGITYQSPEGERVLEIGWHVHRDFRRRGYATEAAQACLAFGFERLQASALCSIVDPANAASIRVAERVHAGRRAYQGKSGPMLLYHTTAAEFVARSAPA